MPSEAIAPADLAITRAAGAAGGSVLRYAQCWEDADVLLEALDVREGHVCLSVASAGDNTLALLARGPAQVVAVDRSPAQLACLELRVTAYRELDYDELLELLGSRPSERRPQLYRRCRRGLSRAAREFWDARPAAIIRGVGAAGKFEHYFALFRHFALPIVHRQGTIRRLLQNRPVQERRRFYRQQWDTSAWRLMFHLFFSRAVMARLGRDPRCFRHVNGDVAGRILQRAEYALTELDPAANPYLQWILTGSHPRVLPFSLRPENVRLIRQHLDRLQWHCGSVEDLVAAAAPASFDRCNLSDIFEYMPSARYHRLLERLVAAGRRGGRLAYWNMLAPRRRPDCMANRLRPLDDLARRLHARDNAFFYSDFVVEEIV